MKKKGLNKLASKRWFHLLAKNDEGSRRQSTPFGVMSMFTKVKKICVWCLDCVGKGDRKCCGDK
jgi:hypothetical protein